MAAVIDSMLISLLIKEVQVMVKKEAHLNDQIDIEHDAIDEYFECITACSLGEDGIHCFTQCVDIHLKKEVEQWSLQILYL